MFINISRVGVRRMGPDSFQWCPVTGQGATGTNWSIGSSIWIWGRTSSLWGWRSTGTGCPEELWNLLLWRHQNPPGCGPVQLTAGDPALSGGWTRWSPEVPSNPYHSMILWFCEGEWDVTSTGEIIGEKIKEGRHCVWKENPAYEGNRLWRKLTLYEKEAA